MADCFCIHCGAKRPHADPASSPGESGLPAFSPREQDVISLILSGYTEGQMADALYLTVGTVKTYKRNIFKKLGIHARRELFAAIYARDVPAGAGKSPGARGKPRSLFCPGCGQVLLPAAQYCGACGKKV
ncbi:MAG: response regulator transcription factor [Oscillospiraceae bacterium]|jgi:DNA-binding CsgD family transcriptional regulator